MPVHALVAQCALSVLSAFRTQDSNLATRAMFWLFRMQNSQNNVASPMDPTGEGDQPWIPPRLPSCTTAFLLATLIKKPAPLLPLPQKKKKIARKSTANMLF